MQVRHPEWSFAGIEPHWCAHIEFAQRVNASSTLPTQLEPYVIKVVLQAKGALDQAETALHENVAVFVRQEVQHCRLHRAFNERLCTAGYPEIAAYEAELKTHLDWLMAAKSLRFNLAYAAAIEAMGALGAKLWFDLYGDYLEGADQSVVDLWRWHMAEEHEHRQVAFDVYQKLYGERDVLSGWPYRAYVLALASRDISAHTDRVAAYLLAKDRERMGHGERKSSLARDKRLTQDTSRCLAGELLKLLSPFYDPGNVKPADGMEIYLARYQSPAGGGR